MHELSLVQALAERLESLASERRATGIRRVVLEVGAIANVSPELLEQAFSAFQEAEPLLRGAALEVRRVPLRLRCRRCGRESMPERPAFRCPVCSSSAEVVQGEELLLRQVELEVESIELAEEEPCIARP